MDMRKTFLWLLLWLSPLAYGQAQAQTTISLWNAHNPSSYLDDVLALFHQQNNNDVIKNNFLSEKLREEVLNQASTNSLPDVLYVPADFVGINQTLSASLVPDEWLSEQLDQRILASGQVDGLQYGIPLFQGNHLVLYYNKSLVTNPIASFEALSSQASDQLLSHAFPITWHYREMYWFVSFLGAFGGWPLEDDKVTLDTPAMVQALNYYRGLKDKGLVDPNCNHDCGVQRFIDGQSPYMINGDWTYQTLRDALGDKLGVALLPQAEAKPLVSMFSSYVLVFPDPDQDKLPALREFAKFMQGERAQQIVYQNGRLIPANLDALAGIEQLRDDNDLVIEKQMTLSRAMPNDKLMTIAWIAMQRGFNRFMDHGYTAEQTATMMQSLADAQINRAGLR